MKRQTITHLSINDNLYFVDGSVFREDVVDLLFCSVQTQSEHAETSRRRGIFLLTVHGVYFLVGEPYLL